ncbi:hypothetical protein RFI_15217 [Reticulomyxa filosa]|uniref:Uncharacterized protein n=1 Tax=Reticulomyxa filosa TaxID=46433 RepID=X6N6U2_RETFI|nr:hypothetical protein RFI_15217 [Reticulomyxa filosa]|eukprot:ETO21985.1 hypothetical protein RFI_15217 [Reticulomyxa filosa]
MHFHHTFFFKKKKLYTQRKSKSIGIEQSFEYFLNSHLDVKAVEATWPKELKRFRKKKEILEELSGRLTIDNRNTSTSSADTSSTLSPTSKNTDKNLGGEIKDNNEFRSRAYSATKQLPTYEHSKALRAKTPPPPLGTDRSVPIALQRMASATTASAVASVSEGNANGNGNEETGGGGVTPVNQQKIHGRDRSFSLTNIEGLQHMFDSPNLIIEDRSILVKKANAIGFYHAIFTVAPIPGLLQSASGRRNKIMHPWEGGDEPVVQIQVRKVFASNAKPVLMDCYMKDPNDRKVTLSSSFILKKGDDLRKDSSFVCLFVWQMD